VAKTWTNSERSKEAGVEMMKSKYIATVVAGLIMLAVSACTDNPTMNAATGAVVGGVVGNQIGSGSGRTAATIVGAGAGAAIGANATR